MNVASSPPLSGWYLSDSTRYCFLISDSDAPWKQTYISTPYQTTCRVKDSETRRMLQSLKSPERGCFIPCKLCVKYLVDEGQNCVFEDFRGSVEYRRLLCVFTGSKLRTSYGLYSWYSLSSLDTLYASSRNTAQPNNKAAFLKIATYKQVKMSHKNIWVVEMTSGLSHFNRHIPTVDCNC